VRPRAPGRVQEAPIVPRAPVFSAEGNAGARYPERSRQTRADHQVAAADAFREHLDGTAPLDAPAEAALADVVARARQRWPEIAVPPEEFRRYVAERSPPGPALATSLADLHAADLLVACGCTRRDPAALAAFERHFIARLASYLSRTDALPAFTDEVKQAVRVRLLVAEEGLLPRIAGYQGRGPLAVWLRLAAVRLAIALRKARQGEGEGREEIDGLATGAADPELAFFKTHYREELRAAVEGALLSLPARDGNLLRLHFFERLSPEIIGAMNGVSARTVQRWLAEVRGRIMADARRRLTERARLDAAQLDSVIGLVGNQLDLSITRLFARIASARRT
jgi:RNA polymerase sigma-70 factor (ECF subfamily)